ncbi:MAG: nucleotide exchange factor GrpE [Candidatus Omnitrophota bacterium]
MFGANKKDEKMKESDELSSEARSGEVSSGDPGKKSEDKKDEVISLTASEHEKLVRDAFDYKDKYIRLLAEFDNLRKRTEREKIEFVKYANEGLLSGFLNILDDLERSVEAAKIKHQDYEAFLKGIEIVMAHVYDLLKRNGVKPIDAKGKMFDPNFHEPLMQEETDQSKEGTIIEEFQKGYLLEGRVLRTSKVKVAAAKTAKPEA